MTQPMCLVTGTKCVVCENVEIMSKKETSIIDIRDLDDASFYEGEGPLDSFLLTSYGYNCNKRAMEWRGADYHVFTLPLGFRVFSRPARPSTGLSWNDSKSYRDAI